MRAAIYFTPPADHELTRVAALWLGRDAFTGEPTRPPDSRVDPLVTDPARYGFHATIRAPFRLDDGVAMAEVESRLRAFAAERRSFALPEIRLSRLGGFIALTPPAPPAELAALEAAVLEAFEPFRAPPTGEEVARRRPERLTERQRTFLDRWGYPFVREEFRFHMTLTNSLPPDAGDKAESELRARFAAFDGAPLPIDGLALFVEEAANGPFRISCRAPFAPAAN